MSQTAFRAGSFAGLVGIWRRALGRAAWAKPYALAGMVALGLLLAPLAWELVPASGPSSAQSHAALPADLGFFLGGALRLGGIIVLAWVSLRLLWAYQSRLGRHRPGNLRVIDTVSLASQRSLYLVQVGDRQLLIGVTPSQISLLGEMPAPVPPESASFREVLSAERTPAMSALPDRRRRNGHLRTAAAPPISGSAPGRRLRRP